MNKSLYFIECTANSDIEFDNGYANTQYCKEKNLTKIIFHKGDIVYFNPKVSSLEMFIGYGYLKNPYWFCDRPYLPFTRQKKFAKKWKIKEYADKYARFINEIGHFTAIVKEIKITYTEEEV